jgi:hypothetical protein
MIDGKGVGGPAPNQTGRAHGLQNDRRYESLVQIRRSGVKVYLDGTLFAELQGAMTNVASYPQWALPDASALGLGSFASPTVFHHVEVVEISGPGEFLRPDGAPAGR